MKLNNVPTTYLPVYQGYVNYKRFPWNFFLVEKARREEKKKKKRERERENMLKVRQKRKKIDKIR